MGCASSTTSTSQPAATACADRRGSAVRKSMLVSTSWSSRNGLASASPASIEAQRSSSKIWSHTLKRRSISTNHWCTSDSGTSTRIRLARPQSSRRWRMRQASMVFPSPPFVQEHYAPGAPVGDLLGDIELVRNEVNAAAEKSAHRGLARAVEQLQSAAAQLKRCRGIKASRKQTLLRPPQTEAVAQLGFGQPLVFADVNQQASLLDDLFDNELLFLTSSDLVARPKAHALKRRMLCGISARFADRFKLDQDATFFRVHDRGQPELRLRLADPPLAYDEPTHENAAGCMRVLPDKRNL